MHTYERSKICTSYRNFHFLWLICKQLSPWLRRSGQRGGAVVQPRHRHHPIPPHSVDADAYSTLPALECLSADLCRSLGGVSVRPSALSDPLLRRSGAEDARVWQSGKERVHRVSLSALRPGHASGG